MKRSQRFDEQIQEYSRPFEEAIQRLDTIPSVARETAEIIVAEIGIDMSRFPLADHLAAGTGVAPDNDESAGKRSSGKTRPGNKQLRTALTQAAAPAKQTYLVAQYRCLAGRRGKKKAIIAVTHSILVIAYHLIDRHENYHDLGSDYFDKRRPETTAKHLIKRLEALGYTVALQSQTV